MHSFEHENQSSKLVQVAYAKDPAEAGLIQGLLENGGIQSVPQAAGIDGLRVGLGILGNGPQRVMVQAQRAEEARALLAEVLVENEQEAWPEPANARYLEDAAGRKPRSYGRIGAYARIYLWSFGAMAIAFGIFMLLRAV